MSKSYDDPSESFMRRDEELLHLFLQSSPIGIAIGLIDGTIVKINPAFCQILGLSESELSLTKLQSLLSPGGWRSLSDLFSGARTEIFSDELLCPENSQTFEGNLCLTTFREGESTYFLALAHRTKEAQMSKGMIRDMEKVCRGLLEEKAVAMAVLDRDHKLIRTNSQWARIFGTASPVGSGDSPCFLSSSAQDGDCCVCPGNAAMKMGTHFSKVFQASRPDGRQCSIDVHAFPIQTGQQKAQSVLLALQETVIDQGPGEEEGEVSSPISQSEKTQKEALGFRILFERAGIGMIQFSGRGQLLRANPAFCAFVGYTEDELLEMRLEDLLLPEDLETLRSHLQTDPSRPGAAGDFEGRFRHREGKALWGITSIVCCGGQAAQDLSGVALVQNITSYKETEREFEHLAHYDPLTGLPNRLLLQDRLDQALARAQCSGSQMAVLLLDLNRFNHVNDSLGLAAGDGVLRHVAKKLSACASGGDTVARFGGDKFIMIQTDVLHLESVRLKAKEMLETLAGTIPLDSDGISITASIGIALYPEGGKTPEELLRNADSAMCRAKKRGGNHFEFYCHKEGTLSRHLQRMEACLRQAVSENQLILHYQPVLRLCDRTLVGFEALIRWHHPEWGIVPPDNFIPIAEETGLISSIGRWAIEEACRQAWVWQATGIPFRMSVNVSPGQFRGGEFAEDIRQILQKTSLSPEILRIELTEGMIMEDVDQAIGILKELSSLGVSLAIDDFGTGHSSLFYLKNFPIQSLKVDRSFVNDLMDDPRTAAIVSAIIALGQSMELEVVAEGIETEDQYRFLQEKNCQLGQGFLFSRPLPPGEIEETFLSSGSEALSPLNVRKG